jgi:hypothetical protein
MKLVGKHVQRVTLLFPLPHDICCRDQGESVILVLAQPLSRSNDADHKPNYLIILVAWSCLSWSNHTRGPEYISLDRRGKSHLAQPCLTAWVWTSPKPTFITTQLRSSVWSAQSMCVTIPSTCASSGLRTWNVCCTRDSWMTYHYVS